MAKHECARCARVMETRQVNGWTVLVRSDHSVDASFRATWHLNLPVLMDLAQGVVEKVAAKRAAAARARGAGKVYPFPGQGAPPQEGDG